MKTLFITPLVLMFLVSLPAFADKVSDARSYCLIKDYERCAREYLSILNEEDNSIAAHNLAHLYLYGLGVPKDGKIAVTLLKKAIRLGINNILSERDDGASETTLGWIYLSGKYPGVDRNPSEALSWTLRATTYGHTNAYSNLALIYASGFGVEKNYAASISNLIKSIETFDKKFNWIFERKDGWEDLLLDGSTEIWNARSLYWQAVKTGDQFYSDKLRELEQKFVSRKREHQSGQPNPVVKTETTTLFSNQPVDVQFTTVPTRQDDIAVIIGNANYEKLGKDIPNVSPAYADAEGIKRYLMEAKGVREGNIIYLKDATGSQLLTVFGNQNTHKGQLFNWVKPQVSNVYIYYVGHGVPGGKEGNSFLVPSDADSQSIELSGYPLKTFYSNLGKLPAKSITVILEACFSGASQAGNMFSKSSPIVIRPTETMIPENVKVISAGAIDQMASWEQDASHSLFTKYFLKAMGGEGDKNNDGEVSDTELRNYLDETMTYYARRYYGRDQTVQIMQGN